ncbi:unnamed protein product [Thelazia callipaeda]|uniref:7TM_GPCR_Srx domain-containing protein n=1 Tax=Thelazia callipaeda TaxID=103827 RepID=A0A0N5D0B7_THECL|nr:unnamed protein product [Thelazia callipaeda]
MNTTTEDNWYHKPLSSSDIIAGGLLFCFAIIFLSLYIFTDIILYRKSNIITGFYFLLSASIANILLLLSYSLWPSIFILFKKHYPECGRRIYQLYMDWIWFSMCYHIPLIAWTRLSAISHPLRFRLQKSSSIYISCILCYIISFLQSMIIYFQPWYVTFYYEASAYGMVPENVEQYLKGGKSMFFIIFHSIIIGTAFIFYSIAVFLLLKRRRRQIRNIIWSTNIFASCKMSPKSNRVPSCTRMPNSMRIEIKTELMLKFRLISPCICSTVIFIIGQIVIVHGTGKGRWATWLILVLFTFTAAIDPILLLIFSKYIRQVSFTFLFIIFCRFLI